VLISMQDKQQTLELQLQELSERVSELQLERDQLQRAVEVVTRNMQVQKPLSAHLEVSGICLASKCFSIVHIILRYGH
jgi:hypothetical protein